MKILYLLSISSLLAIIIFLLPLLYSGFRDIGVLENIHGRPFPSYQESTYITEKISHADIYLEEPVFAKELHLDITFIPGNSQNITLGIRHQSFWLGYNPVTIYAGNAESPDKEITRQVTIPLTDKFQEPDRSIDLMLFADYIPAAPDYELGPQDTTNWQIRSITARTSPAIPAPRELLDYAASLALRERAI